MRNGPSNFQFRRLMFRFIPGGISAGRQTKLASRDTRHSNTPNPSTCTPLFAKFILRLLLSHIAVHVQQRLNSLIHGVKNFPHNAQLDSGVLLVFSAHPNLTEPLPSPSLLGSFVLTCLLGSSALDYNFVGITTPAEMGYYRAQNI